MRGRASRLRIGRIGRIAIALASLLISLVLVEAALRIVLHGALLPIAARSTAGRLRDPHPVLGWIGRPGAAVWRRQLDYVARVEMNSRGFRDGEHPLAKPAGTYRIVMLGDSFMEATQTPLETSFPRLLEEALGPEFEVINLGMSGYGTLQELLLLDEVGMAYHPDLVLLAFFDGNDVRDNSGELEHRLWQSPEPMVAARPYAKLDLASDELVIAPPARSFPETTPQAERAPSFDPRRHTLLGRLAVLGARRVEEAWREWWRGRPQGPDPNLSLGWPVLAGPVATGRQRSPSPAEYRRLWDEAWQTTARLIVEIHARAVRGGARFLLVSIPSRLQVEAELREAEQRRWPDLRFDPSRINRALAELAERHGFDCLDLLPAFEAADRAGAPPLYHHWEDEHWSPAGHRVAADAVAQHLSKSKQTAQASHQGGGVCGNILPAQ